MATNTGIALADEQHVSDLLREHDIMPTQQRVGIARVMLARHQHLSAERLLDEVKHHQAGVSKATIYNTLGLFVSKGLVREVIVEAGRVFYDSNIEAHHHIFNVDSGTLSDIPAQAVNIEGLPDLPEGVRVDGIDVVVRVRNS
ncbi:MAG: Fur family transcriptional regulator [Gammaproteobacteria bacterium]